jgi:hypothetical protein
MSCHNIRLALAMVIVVIVLTPFYLWSLVTRSGGEDAPC